MNVSRRWFLKGFAATTAATVGSVVKTARANPKQVAPSDDAVGLLYDSTRCIGCQACVVKCREVNGLPATKAMYDAPGDLDGHTKNVIKLFRSGPDAAFMKSQCMHCLDPACVSVCMISALQKVEHGIVAYNKDRCIGCRYCQVACPFDVPKFEWASNAPKIVKCELCRGRLAEGKLPGCVEVCPKHAVIYGKREELLAEAHKRITAEPELYQHKVYGETDGGGTQCLYLSAVPFDKLGLPDLGDEAPPKLPETIQHGIYRGFIAPSVLYVALGAVILRNRKKAAPPGPTVAEKDEKAKP